MSEFDALIEIRQRIGLIETRLRILLETHEACRLACNDLLSAYEHRHRRTNLAPLAGFLVHDQVETEPSATEAVLRVCANYPKGQTVEEIAAEVMRLAPHTTLNAVRTAISRLLAKGALRGRSGKGALYRLDENAVTNAGYTRRRRRLPVSERIDPNDAASPVDFNAAAALLLVLHGPMKGPDLLDKLKNKLKPRGKYELKYLESNIGKDEAFVKTDFGYWLAGLPLPKNEIAIRKARVKGSRSSL